MIQELKTKLWERVFASLVNDAPDEVIRQACDRELVERVIALDVQTFPGQGEDMLMAIFEMRSDDGPYLSVTATGTFKSGYRITVDLAEAELRSSTADALWEVEKSAQYWNVTETFRAQVACHE